MSVGGDDREHQAGNPNVEIGGGSGADKAQANPFALARDARPVPGGGRAVQEIGVGGGRHVAQIGRVHARLVPHRALRQSTAQPELAGIARKIAGGRLREIIIAAHLLQVQIDLKRSLVRPVAEHDRIVAVGRERRLALRFDDHRAVEARLLRQCMGMVPEGAALLHDEAVGKGFARRDSAKADPWHAIHVRRQDQAVPVDAGHLVQAVLDPDRYSVAFAQPDQRPWHAPVDGGGDARFSGIVDRDPADFEIELGTAQHGRRRHRRHCERMGGPTERGKSCREQKALHEASATCGRLGKWGKWSLHQFDLSEPVLK